MTQKVKSLLISLSLIFSFAAPVAVTSSVLAAPCAAGSTTCTSQTDINSNLKCGSNIDLSNPAEKAGTSKCDTTTSGGTDLGSILRKIINILSVLVGAIAVIMLIIGGFRYVTSAGSESGVSAAKKTIMYALIGLVIVALAQVVVHFVLNNIA